MTTDVPRDPLAPRIAAMRLPFKQACGHLGLSGSTLKLYRDHGMTEKVADRMAAKAGLPAYDVWPEMLDKAIAGVTRLCVICNRPFAPTPRAHNQLTCGDTCRSEHKYRSQRDRLRARSTRPTSTTCEWCGIPIPLKPVGRPRRFCRDAHRQAYNRDLRSNPSGAPMNLTADAIAAMFESTDELGGIPDVTLIRCTPEQWPTMVDSPLERATGYALVFGAPVSDDPDDGHEVTVAYCPEVIAATVAALPVSPQPESSMLYIDVDAPVPDADPNGLANDLESVCFADNYVRLVIQGLNGAIIGGPDSEFKSTAEWVLDTHPSANQLVMLVQFAAIDGAASVG